MRKLVAAFVGLNALDITLTLIFVGAGLGTELNPYMRQVLSWPLPCILLFKIGLPLLLGMLLIAIEKHPAARIVQPRGILKIIVCAMAGICLFNMVGVLAV